MMHCMSDQYTREDVQQGRQVLMGQMMAAKAMKTVADSLGEERLGMVYDNGTILCITGDGDRYREEDIIDVDATVVTEDTMTEEREALIEDIEEALHG